MRHSLFRDVTQRRLVVTDVSVQPIGPIFKGQAIQEEYTIPVFDTESLNNQLANKKENTLSFD
jgi:hypothetical protein